MHRFARILSIALLAFNAVGAFYGGLSFILDPSGSGMGMDTDLLAHSPFDDYLIPGLILFAVNGVMNVAIALMVAMRKGPWPLLVFAAGALLAGWIGIQIFLLRQFLPLHAIMGGTGIALMLLGLVQRRHRG